jgi:hypothetical protein
VVEEALWSRKHQAKVTGICGKRCIDVQPIPVVADNCPTDFDQQPAIEPIRQRIAVRSCARLRVAIDSDWPRNWRQRCHWRNCLQSVCGQNVELN